MDLHNAADLLFSHADAQEAIETRWLNNAGNDRFLDTVFDESDDEEDMFGVRDGYDLFYAHDESDSFDADNGCHSLDATTEVSLTPIDQNVASNDDKMTQEDGNNLPNESVHLQHDRERQYRDRYQSNTFGECALIRTKNWVIARLEGMLEDIVVSLIEGRERLTFTLESRAGISRRGLVMKSEPEATPAPKIRQVSFPGNTAREAWNFS